MKRRAKMRNTIKELIICTIVPAIIPVALFIPRNYVGEEALNIFISVCYVVDLVFIIRHYCREYKEKRNILADKINSTAYTNAYQLSERKRDYIIKKTYKKDYHILTEAVPYNVHDYIAEICKNFRDTISQITSINQEHMSVTFIYHYDYKGATDEDMSWRWLVGKEASTRTELDEFVERETSLYNYLINESSGNSIFYNDKKELAYEGHYFMSRRDKDHNKIGSVFAVKVLFGNNAENFVEGILLVSSYGEKFVNANSEYSESELKNLIFEDLYPYYQRLLETELGILYLRHEKKQDIKNSDTGKKICDANFCCKKERSLTDEVVNEEL